jgi:hypothetical protein
VKQEGDSLQTDIGKIDLITPEYILQLLADDKTFVTKILQNLTLLYQKKAERYADLYNKAFDPKVEKKDDDSDEKESQRFSLKAQLFKMYTIASNKHLTLSNASDMQEKISVAITDRRYGILSLSGDARKPFRDFLATQIYILSRSWTPFHESFLNIALMGPAGTGKSKLANVIAFVYGKLGILLQNYPQNIIIGSAKDVVASFEGQTVNKTNTFLGMGLESVIFIDEAYSIMSCKPNEELSSEQGYGTQAITEIVNFLDLYRGLAILIVAGYEKAMKNCFFSANQGLPRRFPFQYILQPYSSDDLTAQFLNTVNERFQKNMFDADSLPYVKYLIEKLNTENLFPNQAGDVANLASIFATVIESYPAHEWDDNTKTNVFMLSQVYNTYVKQKGKPEMKQPTRSSKRQQGSKNLSALNLALALQKR